VRRISSLESGRLVPRPGILLLATLALVAAVYHGSLSVPFVSDDHALIEENTRLRQPRSLLDSFTESFWSRPERPGPNAYYRPVTTLSYVLEYRLWGARPRGFHGTNLLLHLGCCALVFLLCRQAGAALLAALMATLLFGLFPRSTESVTWISGRTDLLAALGALGALALHSTMPGRDGRRIAAAAALLFGLLAKEVAIAGAAAIAALEWAARRGRPNGGRRIALHLAPAALALLVWVGLRAQFAEIHEETDIFGPLLRVLFAFQALGTYLLMLLDPLRPSAIIGKLGVIEPSAILAGGLSLAGIIGLGFRLALRGAPPAPSAAFALGVASLAPVLHLIPIPFHAVAADRFLYLPAAGLALAAGWGGSRMPARLGRGAAAGAAALAVAFAISVHVRNLDWQDEIRFWEVTAEQAPPESPEPHAELGTRLAWRGEAERALVHYERAIALQHDFARRYPRRGVDPLLRANAALVLSEVGRYDAAAEILESLVREDPERPAHRLHVGAVYARQLEFDRATRELEIALELYPDYELAAAILRQVKRAREIWSALPPERLGEPLAAAAGRAEVFELVGRLSDADRAWSGVAEAPTAPAAAVLRAAQYLVYRGRDIAAAERAIARLHELEGPSVRLLRLQQGLARRARHSPL
jgi:tetratricopeptide (TPR) repeat protein